MNTLPNIDDETEPCLTPVLQKRLQTASKTIKVDTSNLQLEVKSLTGNALVQSQTTVMLGLIDTAIVLTVQLADRLAIGRQEVDSSNPIEIDLTSYGGREKGVSRQHAALYRTRHTLSLVDLDSTNGTYLNGVRLTPHQPRLLRDGDEICLGNMRLHTRFDDKADQTPMAALSKHFRA
jgi:pSer/pThr/pTyr-binding forkhead associated (FHA) protein